MSPKADIQVDQAPLLQALAEFRYQLRLFQQFSENAAQHVGLHSQQHQLLLQIAGIQADGAATISYAAERLGLRHHSVVELVNRSVEEGLLLRSEDKDDRRKVILLLTTKGRKVLHLLSEFHAKELLELGPGLIRSLKKVETLFDRQSSNFTDEVAVKAIHRMEHR
jgi:DNA-binding MarR family transcriptional regulator